MMTKILWIFFLKQSCVSHEFENSYDLSTYKAGVSLQILKLCITNVYTLLNLSKLANNTDKL